MMIQKQLKKLGEQLTKRLWGKNQFLLEFWKDPIPFMAELVKHGITHIKMDFYDGI